MDGSVLGKRMSFRFVLILTFFPVLCLLFCGYFFGRDQNNLENVFPYWVDEILFLITLFPASTHRFGKPVACLALLEKSWALGYNYACYHAEIVFFARLACTVFGALDLISSAVASVYCFQLSLGIGGTISREDLRGIIRILLPQVVFCTVFCILLCA